MYLYIEKGDDLVLLDENLLSEDYSDTGVMTLSDGIEAKWVVLSKQKLCCNRKILCYVIYNFASERTKKSLNNLKRKQIVNPNLINDILEYRERFIIAQKTVTPFFLYEHHTGGYYVSDKEYLLDELYCKECCRSDFVIGTFFTKKELREIFIDYLKNDLFSDLDMDDIEKCVGDEIAHTLPYLERQYEKLLFNM